MPIINPDTKDMVEFKPLEPGPYRARVVSVTPGTSKAGNPKITVQFEVNAGDRVIPRKADLGYTGKGTQGFDHFLRACGFTEMADKYRAGQGEPFDTDSFLGIELTVHIIPQIGDNNKVYDNIDDFSAA